MENQTNGAGARTGVDRSERRPSSEAGRRAAGLADPRAVDILTIEDARCVAGMDLLRQGYVEIVPDVERFFLAGRDSTRAQRVLGHGSPQRRANLANSLTTTSGTVAALNSILAGALAGDLLALAGASLAMNASIGAAVSLASGGLHVRYAARFRRRHAPSTTTPA